MDMERKMDMGRVEEIVSMVKSNIHGYESISLANDDVERLLIVIKHLQKQKLIEGD